MNQYSYGWRGWTSDGDQNGKNVEFVDPRQTKANDDALRCVAQAGDGVLPGWCGPQPLRSV